MAVFGWKKEVKTVIKVIFGAVSFLVGLSVIIVSKAILSCAVYMDDSFRWGGRDGNG